MTDEDFRDDTFIFSGQAEETKYYYLTGGSGYPLAEFMPRHVFGNGGTTAGLVVAEKGERTTNKVPWIDPPGLEQKGRDDDGKTGQLPVHASEPQDALE